MEVEAPVINVRVANKFPSRNLNVVFTHPLPFFAFYSGSCRISVCSEPAITGRLLIFRRLEWVDFIARVVNLKNLIGEARRLGIAEDECND